MAESTQLLIWESNIVTAAGENRAVVTAQRPLFRMSVKQAARVMQCSEGVITKAFRSGKLTGWKPGEIAKRTDGKRSNASIVLDAGSVLAYKESVTQRGVF